MIKVSRRHTFYLNNVITSDMYVHQIAMDIRSNQKLTYEIIKATPSKLLRLNSLEI